MSLYKIIVVLKLKLKNINILLGQIWALYSAMNANQSQFPSPTVTLVAWLALYQAAVVAQAAVQAKTPGAVKARLPKIAALVTATEQQRAYVTALCASLTVEQAEALAAAAGMKIKATPIHDKPVLQANRGNFSGDVDLIANANALAGKGRGRRCFNWQWSVDGKNWTSIPSTPGATTTISGLTPLTTYLFRVSASRGKTLGAWSQAVSLIVH